LSQRGFQGPHALTKDAQENRIGRRRAAHGHVEQLILKWSKEFAPESGHGSVRYLGGHQTWTVETWKFKQKETKDREKGKGLATKKQGKGIPFGRP